MNLEQNPTLDELRELIEPCDDLSGHHVLWVAKNGDVRVTRLTKDLTPVGFQEATPDMQLRYETFQAGNDYVGPEAALDDDWLKELLEAIGEKWHQAKGKPVVEYCDQI